MSQQKIWRYDVTAALLVTIAAFYPLLMGVKVIWAMLLDGVIAKEAYPKYIIPYTPISVAVLLGVCLMPLFAKWFQKHAFAVGASVSAGAFFGLEWLLEEQVIVAANKTVVQIKDWQMYMCYISPDQSQFATYKTQTPIEILMGEYHPGFKLHFYMISVALVVALLNSIYGFRQIMITKSKRRLRPLIWQSVATGLFLGLCILACFTAFYRDGSLTVSPLSAGLMAAFFILLGMVVGIAAGSFLLDKPKWLLAGVPALTASLCTAGMYAGEMILLNGNVYRFGQGLFFRGIAGLVLAPADLCIIMAAGGLTALLFWAEASRPSGT